MVKDFKIYYNDSFVLITSDRSQMNKNFATIFIGEKEADSFLSSTYTLFDGRTNKNILIISDKPDKVVSRFRHHVTPVVAGGGIVFNQKDELLMIHRRGKWDLPKGKIELKEEIKNGAVREVEEETGVLIKSISPVPVHTFHAYKLNGKNCLKETNWYEMKAKPNQQKLTPQTEEDIEEARWVKRKDLNNYQTGSYPLIWDLISRYKK